MLHIVQPVMDTPAHILVVDDDADIRELTAGFLQRHGYRVDTAADAEEARERLAARRYDLAVLDVMMPGHSGLDLLRGMDRATAPAIIIMSVIGQEVDRIVGLEMGADDYMAKPANPRELLARIRSVLRRGREAGMADEVRPALHFAGWSLDPLGRQLLDPEEVVINLSDGEYRLLTVLLEHPRRVLTRDFLLEQSRGANADQFDRAIDVQVSRLRRKLARDDGRGGDDLIRTVRNEGYMFAVAVERR